MRYRYPKPHQRRQGWSRAATLVLACAGIVSCAEPIGPTAPRESAVRPALSVQTLDLGVGCTGGEAVLLIQDNVPWEAGSDQDPLGANVTELTAQNVDFCMIGSADLESADLGRFSTVVLSAAQAQAFYDRLFPGGIVDPALVGFAERGGVVVANLTDMASGAAGGGSWAGRSFIAGLRRVTSYRNDNGIAAASHPLISGPPECPSGNCGEIQDVGLRQDLDNWYHSSHGYFTNLPAGSTVLLIQPDADQDGQPEPIMVEYAVGAGRVIASMVTTEQRYASSRIRSYKLLANELAYAVSVSSPVPTPNSTPSEQVEELIAQVRALAAGGALSPGNANSLESKLRAALASLDRGRTNAAVQQLRAFMREVEALVRSGRLEPEVGEELLDQADTVVGGLTLD